MFDYRHEITLPTSEKISLFGEDYFGDKKVFWVHHQSELKRLWEKVAAAGFPVTILDRHSGQSSVIGGIQEFLTWLKLHQPFDFSLLLANLRLRTIFTEIRKKCRDTNCREFEYHWEIRGVMWQPWFLYINGNSESFSLNDISGDDLENLCRCGLIEVVKEYSGKDPRDEIDKKRYRFTVAADWVN